MGFIARNIESIFLLDQSDEEKAVARIEELIGDGARLEREESADADGARGWAPVQADDDAWPGGACRYDISRDVVAVLRECKPACFGMPADPAPRTEGSSLKRRSRGLDADGRRRHPGSYQPRAARPPLGHEKAPLSRGFSLSP